MSSAHRSAGWRRVVPMPIDDHDAGPPDPGSGSDLPKRRLWERRAVLGAIVGASAAGISGALWWRSDPATPTYPATPAGDDGTSNTVPDTASVPVQAASRTIAEENRQPGTDAWQVPQDRAVWDKVRGFASRTSVAAGESFELFVSTSGHSFSVAAFRMGYYGGKGGRQVWSAGPIPGAVQPPARVDRATNMRDAPWSPSLTITPDPAWIPGAYLLKLVSDDGGQSQVPIVVRDDERASALHIQHDVTTWQAYNLWGGASLYQGQGGRSTVVSFDRPYDLSGSGNFLGGAYEIGALVESLGIDVTYSTSLDTHARPDALRQHKAWISPAHDEYWSLEMRNGVEAARDAGVNLMFLGANCMFRRIRLEDSTIGPNRHIVNYRSAAADPLNGKDPQRVTTSWREAPAARPESSVTGVFYESNPVKADMVIVDAGAWMFAGTGMKNGDKWPNVVGNEYDRVTPEVPTPPTIQVLAHSPVKVRGRSSFADMTYYTIDSGAGVFSTGTIWFERHLFPGGTGTDAQIVKMMTNLLDVFTAGPAGHTHPSRNNLAQLGIRPGYTTRIEPDPEDRTTPNPRTPHGTTPHRSH